MYALTKQLDVNAGLGGAAAGARALLDLSRSSRHVAYWREITGFLRHAHTRGGGRGARSERERARGARPLADAERGDEQQRDAGGSGGPGQQPERAEEDDAAEEPPFQLEGSMFNQRQFQTSNK